MSDIRGRGPGEGRTLMLLEFSEGFNPFPLILYAECKECLYEYIYENEVINS